MRRKPLETNPELEVLTAIDKYIGNRIRVRRTLLGISQLTLAELMHVSFQQIQKYERGNNRISGGRIWQISRVLNVPVSHFFEGIETHLIAQGYDNVIEYAKDCFFDGYDNYNILKQPYDKHQLLRELVDSYAQIKNQALADGILNLVKELSNIDSNQNQPSTRKRKKKDC